MDDRISDSDLAARYAEVTRHLSQVEAGAAIGVSQKTISNWRAGDVPDSLRPRSLRRAIENVLEGEPRGAEESPYDIAREEEELARVAKEPDPVLRALERESIGSVIRAQALREIAWGNRIAEQNAARREESIRGIATGRPNVGGVISDEAILDAVLNPQQPKRAKASGE